jgi:hypothetical protein
MRCVVDTNVPVTANGGNGAASAECVNASARALQEVMTGGHLFIDADGWIVQEYRDNLSPYGQRGPGDAFFKWLLDHQWGGTRVTQVGVTPRSDDSGGFEELPLPAEGVRYDPADCKFLAVAAAHPEHPPVLQALDSKWWGWRGALEEAGVTIYFVCPEEIARKHEEKMGL